MGEAGSAPPSGFHITGESSIAAEGGGKVARNHIV